MIYTLSQIKDGTGFAPDARFEQVTDYNGWSNRETWAVALWINNDQGMQERVYELLAELSDDEGESLIVKAAWTLEQSRRAGDRIRDYVEEVFDWEQYDNGESPTRGYGQRYCMPSELLSMREDIGSLWRVDWDEIGAAFLRDASES